MDVRARRLRIAASILLTAMLLRGPKVLSSQEEVPERTSLRRQYADEIRPALEKYCIKCHNQKEDQDSNVRLDGLHPEIMPGNVETWTKVKNVLDVGSMPPRKQTARPSREELGRLLAWIGGSLKRFDADHKETGGDTLLRRINNRAYANMIRTLLGVPARGMEEFPEDGTVHGFDTVGGALYMSAHLYELYMNCARRSLDLAISANPSPPPVVESRSQFKQIRTTSFQTHHVKPLEEQIKTLSQDPKNFARLREGFFKSYSPKARTRVVDSLVAAHYGMKTFDEVTTKGIDWANDSGCTEEILSGLKAELRRLQSLVECVSPFQPVFMYHSANNEGFIKVEATVTTPGTYVIRAQLALSHPQYPLPVRLAVDDSNIEQFMLYAPRTDPLFYEAKVFLEKGKHIINIYSSLLEKDASGYGSSYLGDYISATYRLPRPAHAFGHYFFDVPDEEASFLRTVAGEHWMPYCDSGIPTALASELSVRGPVYDSWPPTATARYFTRGVHAAPTREYAEEIVRTFMRRAYSGENSPSLAKPYVDLVMGHYEAGRDFVEAVKYGLAALLCSPRFLYLVEERRAEASRRRPLGGPELARRLAYFLWSDLPDETLVAAAAGGALQDERALLAQTDRMLQDTRSRRFREAFTTQWLKIDKLSSIAVPQELFPAFDNVLRESARRESVAFFSELLDKNLSVLNFIDSGFSMLDGRMATHYGVPNVSGSEFRRVEFAPGSHRGGVLGQASVLMATSNGMVTSPVRRGAFAMERLLGVSPGVPPPNVPALDKIPVAKENGQPLAPRDRLAMHREDVSCARCHDKIDPLGVGLENFDAVGRWNDKQALLRPGPKPGQARWAYVDVDVRGAMLDGTPYNGPDELKQRLLERRDPFVRALLENLMIYALGRELQQSDRLVLDGIRTRVRNENDGLRTLVNQVVLSEAFRNK